MGPASPSGKSGLAPGPLDVDGIWWREKEELRASDSDKLILSCGGGLKATSSSLSSFKFSDPEPPEAFEPVSISSIVSNFIELILSTKSVNQDYIIVSTSLIKSLYEYIDSIFSFFSYSFVLLVDVSQSNDCFLRNVYILQSAS